MCCAAAPTSRLLQLCDQAQPTAPPVPTGAPSCSGRHRPCEVHGQACSAAWQCIGAFDLSRTSALPRRAAEPVSPPPIAACPQWLRAGAVTAAAHGKLWPPAALAPSRPRLPSHLLSTAPGGVVRGVSPPLLPCAGRLKPNAETHDFIRHPLLLPHLPQCVLQEQWPSMCHNGHCHAGCPPSRRQHAGVGGQAACAAAACASHHQQAQHPPHPHCDSTSSAL